MVWVKPWYDGQKEGEEFNRQLSLTGHYAGVTAGQLWTLSRAISGNGITQHAAAGALAQVVGSGAFRGNDIGMVARAAARDGAIGWPVGQRYHKSV